jgi:hypothetical protein
MIVHFIDSVTGTPIHLNPEFVVSLRPDPQDPSGITMVKLRDGETLRVRGDHEKVALRLAGRE